MKKPKHRKKIDCKTCSYNCCDDVVLERCTGNKHDADPLALPTGALIYIEGMWWKRKSDGRWRCIALDIKKNLCKIYKYRPPICRWFKCAIAKKGRSPRMPDNNYCLTTTNYSILLFRKKGYEKK